MQLRDFDIETFLRDYWQQRPLLIRNPWSSWSNPLAPDELAGLACEEGVESRLITREPDNWRAEQGPFPETRFSRLGRTPWTLLVQAVDHHVPEVAALMEPFRFVPNWRIDDVMVSYAADGGGVGPHFDQYDVFLVQGLGRRRWQLGAMCDSDTELLVHDDLRLLADFHASEEWVLEPGDILYVPPRLAHDGVAVGDDCMTYSVGFRAPSRSELIAHYCDDLLDRLDDDDRYADPGLPLQDNPGEITAGALASLQAMIAEAMADPAAFARWFGGYTTERKYPEMDWRPEQPVEEEDLHALIGGGATLLRNPASRFAFARKEAGGVLLFVDGECFDCAGQAAALAELLCAQPHGAVDPVLGDSDDAVQLLVELVNRGCVALEAGD